MGRRRLGRNGGAGVSFRGSKSRALQRNRGSNACGTVAIARTGRQTARTQRAIGRPHSGNGRRFRQRRLERSVQARSKIGFGVTFQTMNDALDHEPDRKVPARFFWACFFLRKNSSEILHRPFETAILKSQSAASSEMRGRVAPVVLSVQGIRPVSVP